MKEDILLLVKRALALKHKLKVYDNVPAPEAHEDLATHYLGRWELEDELNAIEAILDQRRKESVARYRDLYLNQKLSKIS